MSHFTIFGGNGFIGRRLAAAMRRAGQPVSIPARDSRVRDLGSLGHVIYSIGLTADFRERPFDTMDAHVGVLTDILRQGSFDSFLYLSSTRIYDGAGSGNEDAMPMVDPWSPSDLYNLSKLCGESLCLTHPNKRVRVARLSNVYGADMFGKIGAPQNFLGAVILEAIRSGHVRLNTAPASAKDYIHINDAVRALAMIAIDGDERLYNVAAGKSVTHEQLLDSIAEITGCTWDAEPDAPVVGFPHISTQKLSNAFHQAGISWHPADLISKLPDLVRAVDRKEGAIA